MFELKKISQEGIQAAVHQAEHYRLLNEPRQAESICLDILDVDTEHQEALRLLLLALTDQFAREKRVAEARAVLPRLHGEYERAYYAGIICERWGKALLTRNSFGSGQSAYSCLREAMDHYEDAQRLHPQNSDPILRWNACARLINRHEHVAPGHDEEFRPLLE